MPPAGETVRKMMLLTGATTVSQLPVAGAHDGQVVILDDPDDPPPQPGGGLLVNGGLETGTMGGWAADTGASYAASGDAWATAAGTVVRGKSRAGEIVAANAFATVCTAPFTSAV